MYKNLHNLIFINGTRKRDIISPFVIETCFKFILNLNTIKNSLKFKEKKKNDPNAYSDIYPNQLKYWLKQGFNKQAALLKVKERQTTFSKTICIKKYGRVKKMDD